MVVDRRQTIDTADGAYIPPPRAHPSSSDDGSDSRYSTTTTDSLAAFLIGPQHNKKPYDVLSSEKMSLQRRQREEASVAIHSLNHFIFVAGHTFKGRQLNRFDQKRLREAAEQVGLSLELVETLVEQTSDKNAILKYCMASDDAFARKMKSDPQLSRLLDEGVKDDGSGFDVASSVWRIFMHKIVQQFLKDHDMKLSDVMSKESLTARLYQEALSNEKQSTDELEAARIRRDYTIERQKLFISEEEAKLARQKAEAAMDIPTHRSFLGLMPSDGEDYIMSDGQPMTTDDVLSLRPGGYSADEISTSASGADFVDGSRRCLSVSRRLSAPSPSLMLRTKPSASDGEEEVSAVKRGLAVFENNQSQNQEDIKRQRRASLEALEQSKVLKSRAKFEVCSSENMGPGHPEIKRQQRQSLAVLQESSILNTKARFESPSINRNDSEHAGTFQGTKQEFCTPAVRKLHPDASKLFQGFESTDRIKEYGLESHPRPSMVMMASPGSFVKSARQTFEMPHNGDNTDVGLKPNRPARVTSTRNYVSETRENGNDQILLNGSGAASQQCDSVMQTFEMAHNGATSDGGSKPNRPTRASSAKKNLSPTRENHFDEMLLNGSGISAPSRQNDTVVNVEDDMCADTMQNSGMGLAMYETDMADTVIVQRNSDDSNGVLSSLTQSSLSSQEDGHSHSRRLSSRSRPAGQSCSSTSITDPYQGNPVSLGSARRGNGHDNDNMTRPPSSRSHNQREMTYAEYKVTRRRSSDKHMPQFGRTRESASQHLLGNSQEMTNSSARPLQEQCVRESKERLSNDAEKSWVDFGSSFKGTQTRDNTGMRSGIDNDSTRQPRHNTLSPSIRILPEDCRAQRKRRPVSTDENFPVDSAASVGTSSRKTKSLLRDEEQSVIPGIHSMKQSWTSKSTAERGTHRAIDSTAYGEAEHDIPVGQTVPWTKFEHSPFSLAQRTNEVTTGTTALPKSGQDIVVESVYKKIGQFDATLPGSTSRSDDSAKERVTAIFRNVGACRSSKKSKPSLVPTNPFMQGPTYDQDDSFHTESKVIVWTTDVDGSAHDPRYSEEAIGPNDIGALTGKARHHVENIDHAFRRVNKSDESFNVGPLGLYGETEPTRSMSSESDFDAVNAYHDSDRRRIESMQASNQTRILDNDLVHPHRDHDSHPCLPRQPDAPLVSHRGSRASDVMGVVSRSINPQAAMAESPYDMGLNSFPMSTTTSNLDSTLQDEGSIENWADQQQAMATYEFEPHKDFVVDPNQRLIVGGMSLRGGTCQSMHFEPPTLTNVGGSTPYRTHCKWDARQSQNLGQRTPISHPSNQELPEEEVEAVNPFLDSYSYVSRNQHQTPMAPPCSHSTLTPKVRPGSSYIPTQRQDNVGSFGMMNSSDTRSIENTANSEEEEAREDINYLSQSRDHDTRDRYLDTEPDFDATNQGPTSPTQLRSADSESTVDEEDFRLAAQRRGISPDVVDVLLRQNNSKIRRAPLKGVEVPTPTNDPYSHRAPFDSDTGRPASVRHLRKEVGPDCDATLYEQGNSWDENADQQGGSHQRHNSRASPPPPPPPDPPKEAHAILEALKESAAMTYDPRASVHGIPELPEGASEEQINLLNRFIEVASSNFDGKKLSADSEKRVRAAAEKVGLSQKFVDQLLEQANANNSARSMSPSTIEEATSIPPNVGVHDYKMDEERDEVTTYYTNDRTHVTKKRAKKKRSNDDGCNAWEQLDYLKNLVRGWTNCGTPGDVHHEEEDDDDEDGSSISSDGYRDELTRKLRKAQKKKERGRQRHRDPPPPSKEQRGFV